MASETADKASGGSFAGQFFTKPVAGSGKRVPDETSANRPKLVVNPNRNVEAMGPEEYGAANEHNVIENSEEAQRGTGTPKHVTSQPGPGASDASGDETAG